MRIPEDNWRNDPGLKSVVIYRKKFALLPVVCQCGTKLWLKTYYKKYVYWGMRSVGHLDIDNEYNLHCDACENITEAEYLVRRLTEGV